MLQPFFSPKTIALIGATDRKASVGLALAKNLQKSKAKVFFVNPNRLRVLQQRTWAKITDIKPHIDLAVLAVPAEIVPQVAEECSEKEVGGAIIISAGFAETGKEGFLLEEQVKKIFQQAKIKFLGPNCMGIINTRKNINAAFGESMPGKGSVAFLSQSGALISGFLESASYERARGFSILVSLGNSADLDVCDFLSALKADKSAQVIALYLENVRRGAKFLSESKETSLQKPIVVLKGGKTARGQKAAASHTGALWGEKGVYSAAFKKAGIVEVETLEELFETSFALSSFPRGMNGEAGILTNGGASGVLAADYCYEYGVGVADVRDIIGSATHKDYGKGAFEILSQEKVGGLLVSQSNQAMTKPEKIAMAIKKISRKFPEKPVIVCEVGGKGGGDILKKAGIPYVGELKLACFLLRALIQRHNFVK